MGNTSSGGAGSYTDTIEQIRLAVDGEWESVAMTLREHGTDRLGEVTTPGTAAWHLRHIAEIFRLHARHLVGEAVESWPALPEATGDQAAVQRAIGVLRDDVGRLARWAEGGGLTGWGDGGDGGGEGGAASDGSGVVIEYGGSRSVSDMLGVMLRHIVWHAAAAHYWCRWVRDVGPKTDDQTPP